MPSYIPVSGLPMVDEDAAIGTIAALYDRVRRVLQLPTVPNMLRGLSASPGALECWIEINHLFYEKISLPQSLVAMILFAVAKTSNCTYCSAGHELTCRTLGIDELLLNAIFEDLRNVRPERLQAIMSFAIKATQDPRGMTQADYEELRNQGVSDAEITEIIFTISAAKMGDSLADLLKIEVDESIRTALSELRQ
jgi:uncharacterized peroxidase-related enzyme